MSFDRNDLRGPVLRSVSRSFYLSLRILPRPLRDPLSLAYLLARATDTIADTPAPSVELRAKALQELAATIRGTMPIETAARLVESFAPLQSDDAERTLIQQVPLLLEWLQELAAGDRSEVRNVLEKINRGQTLDLERFGAGGEIRALSNADELDEYTYLVAGCVGEFWTRICFEHIKNFSIRPEREMRDLGVQYGQGLQLINVLRDAGNDLRHGRCYFPADELHSLGVTPGEILENAGRVEPITAKWGEKARRGLEAGIDYACGIRNRRIRFATALPALIGARTLTLLQEAGPDVFGRRVKVSRGEIRKMIFSSALASPQSLRAKFRQLGGSRAPSRYDKLTAKPRR
jgi:farnesyl-diphosphate farnesyltransferase